MLRELMCGDFQFDVGIKRNISWQLRLDMTLDL